MLFRLFICCKITHKFSFCQILGWKTKVEASFLAPSQHNGDDNEGDAEIEGEVEFGSLVKEEHSGEDGIDGLEVVGEVDGERRDVAQGLELQEEGRDGEDGGKDDEQHPVARRGDNRHIGEGGGVERYGEGEDDGPAEKFVEEHRAARTARGGLHSFAGDAEECVKQRRDNAQTNAETMPGIEAEDEGDACHGEEPKSDLAPRWTVTIYERLDDGGEESHKGEAHGTDGDVGGLDAAVVEHPVDGEQHAASHNHQQLASWQRVECLAPSHHKGKEYGSQDDPQAHKRQFAHRDEAAEESCSAGDEDGKMQAEIGRRGFRKFQRVSLRREK